MSRLRTATLVVAAALTLPAAGAAQNPATAALLAAADRFENVTALCADFTQRLEVSLLRTSKSSRGRMCQLRPSYFSMVFSDPEGDEIVADGHHFWVHMPSESPGQVMRMPITADPGGLDFYREFLDEPLAKYEIVDGGTAEVGGTSTRVVELTPKADLGYREATVWIDPAARTIRQVRIVERNGTVRTLTLTGLDFSPGIDADFFRYEVPAGATVIRMGGGR